MATNLDYVEFLIDKVSDCGRVRYKKMFGEYIVYVNDKPILLVCDNTVFVKKLDSIAELMKNSKTGFPYNGAKEHYILDIESEKSKIVISCLEKVISLPKCKHSK